MTKDVWDVEGDEDKADQFNEREAGIIKDEIALNKYLKEKGIDPDEVYH